MSSCGTVVPGYLSSRFALYRRLKLLAAQQRNLHARLRGVFGGRRFCYGSRCETILPAVYSSCRGEGHACVLCRAPLGPSLASSTQACGDGYRLHVRVAVEDWWAAEFPEENGRDVVETELKAIGSALQLFSSPCEWAHAVEAFNTDVGEEVHRTMVCAEGALTVQFNRESKFDQSSVVVTIIARLPAFDESFRLSSEVCTVPVRDRGTMADSLNEVGIATEANTNRVALARTVAPTAREAVRKGLAEALAVMDNAVRNEWAQRGREAKLYLENLPMLPASEDVQACALQNFLRFRSISGCVMGGSVASSTALFHDMPSAERRRSPCSSQYSSSPGLVSVSAEAVNSHSSTPVRITWSTHSGLCTTLYDEQWHILVHVPIIAPLRRWVMQQTHSLHNNHSGGSAGDRSRRTEVLRPGESLAWPFEVRVSFALVQVAANLRSSHEATERASALWRRPMNSNRHGEEESSCAALWLAPFSVEHSLFRLNLVAQKMGGKKGSVNYAFAHISPKCMAVSGNPAYQCRSNPDVNLVAVPAAQRSGNSVPCAGEYSPNFEDDAEKLLSFSSAFSLAADLSEVSLLHKMLLLCARTSIQIAGNDGRILNQLTDVHYAAAWAEDPTPPTVPLFSTVCGFSTKSMERRTEKRMWDLIMSVFVASAFSRCASVHILEGSSTSAHPLATLDCPELWTASSDVDSPRTDATSPLADNDDPCTANNLWVFPVASFLCSYRPARPVLDGSLHRPFLNGPPCRFRVPRAAFVMTTLQRKELERQGIYVPDVALMIHEMRVALQLPPTIFPVIEFHQEARHEPAKRVLQLQAGVFGDVNIKTKVVARWGPGLYAVAESDPDCHSSGGWGNWRGSSSLLTHNAVDRSGASFGVPWMARSDTGTIRGPLKLLIAVVGALYRQVFPGRTKVPLIHVRESQRLEGIDFLLYAWFSAVPQIRCFEISTRFTAAQRATCGVHLSSSTNVWVGEYMVRSMLFYDFLGQRVLFAETHDLTIDSAVERLKQLAVELNLPEEDFRIPPQEITRSYRNIIALEHAKSSKRRLIRESLAMKASMVTAAVPAWRDRVAARRHLLQAICSARSELEALLSVLETVCYPERVTFRFALSGGADWSDLISTSADGKRGLEQLTEWRMGKNLHAVRGVAEVQLLMFANTAGEGIETLEVPPHRLQRRRLVGVGDNENSQGIIPTFTLLCRQMLSDVLYSCSPPPLLELSGLTPEAVLHRCRDADVVFARDSYPPYSPRFYHAPRLLGELIQGLAGKYYCTYKRLPTAMSAFPDCVSLMKGEDAGAGSNTVLTSFSHDKATSATFFAESLSNADMAQEGTCDTTGLMRCILYIPAIAAHPNAWETDRFVLGVGLGVDKRSAWISAAWNALRRNYPSAVAQLDTYRDVCQLMHQPVALQRLKAPEGIFLRWQVVRQTPGGWGTECQVFANDYCKAWGAQTNSATSSKCESSNVDPAVAVASEVMPYRPCLAVARAETAAAAFVQVSALLLRLARSSSDAMLPTAGASVNNGTLFFHHWDVTSHYAKSVWHALCGACGAAYGGGRTQLCMQRAAPHVGYSGVLPCYLMEMILIHTYSRRSFDVAGLDTCQRKDARVGSSGRGPPFRVILRIPADGLAEKASAISDASSPIGYLAGMSSPSGLLKVITIAVYETVISSVSSKSTVLFELLVVLRLLARKQNAIIQCGRLSQVSRVEALLELFTGCQAKVHVQHDGAAGWNATVLVWFRGLPLSGVATSLSRMPAAVAHTHGATSDRAVRELHSTVRDLVTDVTSSCILALEKQVACRDCDDTAVSSFRCQQAELT